MSAEPHVQPLRTYYLIFGALLVLTAVTTGAAYLDFGVYSSVVALTIAIVKALLVVLWFMHVKDSGRLVWIFAGAGVLWFLILIGLTMADFDTRAVVQGWGG